METSHEIPIDYENNKYSETSLKVDAKFNSANDETRLLDPNANAIAKDPDGLTALHLAVLGMNRVVFQEMLNRKSNLNARTSEGMTPLVTAAKIGMEDMAIDLINAGADIDVTDRNGMTALHWATIKNCLVLVVALLRKRAKMNIRDCNGYTPLHYAKANIAEKLLSFGANTVVQSNDGRTPLHLAVVTNDTTVFQVLLHETRDLNTRTGDGVTPLMTAVHMGLESMAIELIKAGADVNVADCKGMTALHRVALLDYLNLVNPLLQKGANLNIQDCNECTPLHYAKADMARCLIDAGADANIENNTGFTPLHLALTKCDTILFQILLRRTTQLNTRCTHDNMTPLTNAVKNGMENMVYDLIKAGADVSVDTGRGITALHWAANFSDLPNTLNAATSRANAARILLDAGADPNARNFSGDTPLHIALKTKAWPVFEVIVQHKATDLNSPDLSCKTLLMTILESVPEIEDVAYFEALIKAGASIHAKDKEQMTALHYAVKFGKCDELNLLIKYGADINATDQSKLTALHWAAFCHISADISMENEANLITREGYGQTPLHYDKANIIKSLLDAGANTIARDINGRTPLHLAVLRRNMNAFRLLLDHTTNLNIPTYLGMTPLIAAVHLGIEDMIYYLMTAGADVNVADREGTTALHFAALFSNLPKNSEDKATSRANAARMLLAVGANPNLQNNFGDTALHIAVKTKGWPVFQVLLRDSRTDLNAHNMHDDGKTPLMMILEQDAKVEVFEDLIKAGASVHERDSKGRTALHYATKCDKSYELRLLLVKYGADVNAADAAGNTALLLAAELDLANPFAILMSHPNVEVNVQRGCDGKTLLMVMLESNPEIYDFDTIATRVESIHVRDKKLQTALHYAAKCDKITQLISLVDLEAEINVRDSIGRTPLYLAAREGNYQSCFNLMSVYAADRNISDIRGNKPVDIAKKMNHKHIVDLLNE